MSLTMIEKTDQNNKEHNKTDHNKTLKLFLVLIWAGILVWRFSILIRYTVNYVDDDQALMWYGAAQFAHGDFTQPAFFGQRYGSMFESLLMVPFYYLGYPFDYAQPIVTTMLGLSAFVYATVLCYRRKNYLGALLVPVLLCCLGWRWDVLTSMRCFFTGLPIATIGCLLINDKRPKDVKVIIGSFLAVLGAIWTSSAVAVLGIGFLYFFLHAEERRRYFLWMLLGVLLGSLVWIYRFVFFKLHPDYIIYEVYSRLSFSMLIENLKLLPRRIADFFCGGYSGIVVAPILLIWVIFIFVRSRRFKDLIVVLTAILGSLMMLMSTQMRLSEETTINYCQMRMILYVGYLILLMIVLFSMEHSVKEVTGKLYWIIIAVVAVSSILKISFFEKAYKDQDSSLYQSQTVQMESASDIYVLADTLKDLANDTKADVLICPTNAKALAYAFSAIWYDEPIVFYGFDMDRRTWVYDALSVPGDYRILFCQCDDKEVVSAYYVDTSGESVIDYLKNEFGVEREKIALYTY